MEQGKTITNSSVRNTCSKIMQCLCHEQTRVGTCRIFCDVFCACWIISVQTQMYSIVHWHYPHFPGEVLFTLYFEVKQCFISHGAAQPIAQNSFSTISEKISSRSIFWKATTCCYGCSLHAIWSKR